tara:strand:+ start:479 stop:790 length:312 start_codon:yes stop_codon:yes gene_type:complete
MWLWLVSSVAGSLLGAASTKWFKDTKLGIWCYEKFEDIADWAADRYGVDVLDKEAMIWRQKFPNVAKEIDDLKDEINELAEKVNKEQAKSKKLTSRVTKLEKK